MGNIESKPPLDITEFRKIESPEEEYIIPEVPQKRKVTDLAFLIIFGIVLGLLAILIIYCGTQSRFSLFTRGYDSCGNVCGEKNPTIEGISCSGKDMTLQPYTQYFEESQKNLYYETVTTRNAGYECVEKCRSDSILIFNRCYPIQIKEDTFIYLEQLSNTLTRGAGLLVTQCIIGLGATIGMLALFRYFTKFIFWFNLIGAVFCMVAITAWLWYLTMYSDVALIYAIALSLVTSVLALVVLCLFDKIEIIIKLYRESIKAVFAMPLLLLEPFLTIFSFIVGIICCIFVNLLIRTSGRLTQTLDEQKYDYEPTYAMVLTTFVNIFAALWMSQFIIGCQHMVIAGAVSSYYFAKNKLELVSPVYKSFYSLIRYHLGTVAIGSLVITLVMIIKACLRVLARHRLTACFVMYCMGYIERLLQFLTLNAYIQTAMHGQSFIKSGKRAVQLLWANAITVIATNCIGNFVMFSAKFTIMSITILIGIAMKDDSLEMYFIIPIISAIITLIIAHAFFVVFETSVDTILICYCEDNILNNGTTKPYYMTTDLANYMNAAKIKYQTAQR